MNQWATILATAGMSAGVILLFPKASGAPAGALVEPGSPTMAAAPATRAAEDFVRIDHQLVIVEPASPVSARLRRKPPATAGLRRAPSPAAPQEKPGLAARAGRMIVGDGRYRPEPFPRPDPEK